MVELANVPRDENFLYGLGQRGRELATKYAPAAAKALAVPAEAATYPVRKGLTSFQQLASGFTGGQPDTFTPAPFGEKAAALAQKYVPPLGEAPAQVAPRQRGPGETGTSGLRAGTTDSGVRYASIQQADGGYGAITARPGAGTGLQVPGEAAPPYDVQFDPSVSPEAQAAFLQQPTQPVQQRQYTGFTRTTPDISGPAPEDRSIGGLVMRAADTKQAAAQQKMALDEAQFGLTAYGDAESRRILEGRYKTLGAGELARGEAAQMSVEQAKAAQTMQDAIYAETDPAKREALLAEFNVRYGDPEAGTKGKFIEDPMGEKDPRYAEYSKGGGLKVHDAPINYGQELSTMKLTKKQNKKALAWGKKNPKATAKETYEHLKTL